MVIQTVSAELVAQKNRDQKSSCEVLLVQWDAKDRLKRASVTWLGCWVAAFFAIFLPGLHFVLVPTLLLLGPIASSLVFNQKEWVTGGQGSCPLCQSKFEISRGRAHWPLNDLCSNCGEEIRVQLKT